MESALYIVATPIGNLNDISLRALEILKEVDIIVCEDTRHSKKLLTFFSINKKLISIHQHNEKNKSLEILNMSLDGKSVAYISDAGTPGISDPGAFLVNTFLKAEKKVVPIPGPSALTTAFSVSGIVDHDFQFKGFLPNTKIKAREHLKKIYEDNKTAIIYESPHRVILTLTEIANIFGSEHILVITRELTKIYESIIKDTVSNIIKFYEKNNDQIRGEFVLIITSSNKILEDENQLKETLRTVLKELPLSQSVKLVASIFKKNKKEVYNLALRIKNE